MGDSLWAGVLQETGKEDAKNRDLALERHVKAEDDGKWETQDKEVTRHVQKGCCLVEDVDVPNTATKLGRVGAPIVRDRAALENGHEESANPPAEHINRDGIGSNFEARGGEEADVESEDRGFYDRHSTGMKDLKCVHDLALKLKLFVEREAFARSGGTKVFMLTNACDRDGHNVVDRDTKRKDLDSTSVSPFGILSSAQWLTNPKRMR